MTADLLADTLLLAVPLEARRLAELPIEDLRLIASRCGEQVAAHSDELQYGGSQAPGTFAALSRGLAVLSYASGGVEFGGVCWVHRHPEGDL